MSNSRTIRNLLIVALFWDSYKLAKGQFVRYHQSRQYQQHKMKIRDKIAKLKKEMLNINLGQFITKKYRGMAVIIIDGMNIVVSVEGEREKEGAIQFRVTPMSGYGYTWMYADEVLPI